MAFQVGNIAGAETDGIQVFSSVSGTPVTVSTQRRHASEFSYELSGADTVTLPLWVSPATDQGTGRIVQFHMRTGVISPAGDVIEIRDADGGTLNARLRIVNDGGNDRFSWEDAAVTSTNGSLNLADNTWYLIEIFFEDTGTNDDVTVRVNGTNDIVITNADNQASAVSSHITFEKGWSSTSVYFDNIVTGTGASSISDALGDIEVLGYQTHDNTGAGPDLGDNVDDGSSNNWDNIAERPFSSTAWIAYNVVGAEGAIFTDSGARLGPTSDARPTGGSTWYPNAVKAYYTRRRSGGQGRTHWNLVGNSSATTITTDLWHFEVTLGTSFAIFQHVLDTSGGPTLDPPLITQSFALGFSKDFASGQDTDCGDMLAEGIWQLNAPTATGNLSDVDMGQQHSFQGPFEV